VNGGIAYDLYFVCDTTLCLKITGPLRHNFTNSQHSLIIFHTLFNFQFTKLKSLYIGLEPAAWFP